MPRFHCAVALACLVLTMFTAAAAAADNRAPLKNGETIVFLGDSITEAGAGAKGYVTVIRQALAERFKDLDVKVIGAGVSGNKVPDLQRRLEKAVLAHKPTIVVIYIGINDVWHGESNPANGTTKERFADGLKEIIGKIKDGGGRVILCTPSVIGEKKDGGNNLDAKLDEYSDISRKVATETKSQLCDLRKAFIAYLKENNPENRDRGILTSDRVHLNDAGNRFVASTIIAVLTGSNKKAP
jgi:lysophospholipase L1-like esterase